MKGGIEMKTKPWTASAVTIGALFLLAGCGTATGEASSGPTQESEVTLRGTNSEDMRSTLLTLSDVEVTADGQPVPARLSAATVDLAQPDERVAARFIVPAGAQRIRVMLRFDDYGGYEMTNGEAGMLDARGTRLNFEVPARDLVTSGKVQLSLDLAHSLVASAPERRVLAPNMQISY
jgi:hypothetical protein